MIRRLTAAIVGLLVALAVLAAVGYIDARLYPPPAAFDTGNKAAVAARLAGLPAAALFIVLGGWALGAFAGGCVAMRLARDRASARPALLVALALLAASVANMISVAHPVWFWIGSFIAIPAGSALAIALCRPRRNRSSGTVRQLL